MKNTFLDLPTVSTPQQHTNQTRCESALWAQTTPQVAPQATPQVVTQEISQVVTQATPLAANIASVKSVVAKVHHDLAAQPVWETSFDILGLVLVLAAGFFVIRRAMVTPTIIHTSMQPIKPITKAPVVVVVPPPFVPIAPPQLPPQTTTNPALPTT